MAIPALIIGAIGLGLSIWGSVTQYNRAKEQNRREQQMLSDELANLERWYEDQEKIYRSNVERAEESAEQAVEHVTESAEARMEDLRQDRDVTLWNTQQRTEAAAEGVLDTAISAELQEGEAEAAAGFTGLEREGSVEGALEQVETLGQRAVTQAGAQLDLQRDAGFQQAFGFERGAVRTGEQLGREIEEIDLQLEQALGGMEEQFDLLSDQYEFDVAKGEQQLAWLKSDSQNLGVDLAFNVLGAGLDFATFAFEYDVFSGLGGGNQQYVDPYLWQRPGQSFAPLAGAGGRP